MAERTKPRMPSGLNAAGRSLWRRISDAYELNPGELAILDQACRQADAVAALDAALKGEDLVVEGSRGQVRAHPLVVEARLARTALAGLIARVGIPADDDDGLTATQVRARDAARKRWGTPLTEREG